MRVFRFSILLLSMMIWQVDVKAGDTLTLADKKGILFMREEEKLARDVYDSLFNLWEVNPFGNIRQSERYHMSEMKRLIDLFKLQDPVEKNLDKPGSFDNNILRELYSESVTKGTTSFTEALKAGAKIEEVDIRDLGELKRQTTDPEIIRTYDYLLMASGNHLRAFYRNLVKQGVSYEPVILSRELFKSIINEKE